MTVFSSNSLHIFMYFYQTNAQFITFHSSYSQFHQFKITNGKWKKKKTFSLSNKICYAYKSKFFHCNCRLWILWVYVQFFLIISVQSHSGGNIPSITVQERQITNVYPATGSLRGGTKLIVSGQGFNTLAPVNKVKVGSHDCLVKSSTPSELTCQIADTGRTHLVTNDGIHPSNST